MIIYVDNPEDCKIRVGDTLKYKDDLQPPMVVTEIRKSENVKQPETPKVPNFRCPHCGGDLDEYMEPGW